MARAKPKPAGTTPTKQWVVVGIVVPVLVALIGVAAKFIPGQAPEPEGTRPGTPPSSAAASPPPAVRTPALEPTGTAAGTIRADAQEPDGCSLTYRVSGDVSQVPDGARTLWIVALLLADPGRGDPHDLYFPKARIPTRTGPFMVNVPGNPTNGDRSGRYVLVADQAADTELQTSFESDQRQDCGYPDGRRATLPAGAYAVARTSVIHQRC